MGTVVVLPRADAASLLDARGGHRALQVTWHDEGGIVVVSTWRFGRCVATAQLDREEAAAMIVVLAEGLARHRGTGD